MAAGELARRSFTEHRESNALGQRPERLTHRHFGDSPAIAPVQRPPIEEKVFRTAIAPLQRETALPSVRSTPVVFDSPRQPERLQGDAPAALPEKAKLVPAKEEKGDQREVLPEVKREAPREAVRKPVTITPESGKISAVQSGVPKGDEESKLLVSEEKGEREVPQRKPQTSEVVVTPSPKTGEVVTSHKPEIVYTTTLDSQVSTPRQDRPRHLHSVPVSGEIPDSEEPPRDSGGPPGKKPPSDGPPPGGGEDPEPEEPDEDRKGSAVTRWLERITGFPFTREGATETAVEQLRQRVQELRDRVTDKASKELDLPPDRAEEPELPEPTELEVYTGLFLTDRAASRIPDDPRIMLLSDFRDSLFDTTAHPLQEHLPYAREHTGGTIDVITYLENTHHAITLWEAQEALVQRQVPPEVVRRWIEEGKVGNGFLDPSIQAGYPELADALSEKVAEVNGRKQQEMFRLMDRLFPRNKE